MSDVCKPLSQRLARLRSSVGADALSVTIVLYPRGGRGAQLFIELVLGSGMSVSKAIFAFQTG